MKIRTDFVTNSSSTSFLIITDGDLTREKMRKLLGVSKKNSPLIRLADLLYEAVAEDMEPLSEYVSKYERDQGGLKEFVKKEFSDEVLKRVQDAETSGKKIFYGKLRSEGDEVESFFCMESFELDSDVLYLNALNCVW